jgi:hypothetical protein
MTPERDAIPVERTMCADESECDWATWCRTKTRCLRAELGELPTAAATRRNDVPATPPDAAATTHGETDDLAMLVVRLARSLNNHHPDNVLSAQAMDYLRRKGLQGSPLRRTEALDARTIADAAIGAVVWRFIDRMGDVDDQCDPASKILAEFVEAVHPAIEAGITAYRRALSPPQIDGDGK